MADVLGTFEQAVLLALAQPQTELGKEAYGRALLKEVQLRLEREVSAGAVYATLDRLENKGLIRSEVESGSDSRGGLPRRRYTLEAAGAQALNETKVVIDRLWSGIQVPLKVTG